MARSIAVTLGVSLVLALVLANLGAGMPFGLAFALITLAALPFLVGYAQLTGAGNFTVPKLAWIPIGVVWVIAMYAFLPVMQAAYHAKQPLTYKAIAMAVVTGDIKQAIDIMPLDTAAQAQIYEHRQEMSALAAKELAAVLERFKKERAATRIMDDNGALNPDYISLQQREARALETWGRLYGEWDEDTRIEPDPVTAQSAGFDLSGISELPGVIPYLMLIVGFGVVVSLGYGISTGKNSHYGRAAGWLAFGAVLYIGSMMYMDRNPYAGQVIYSSPASGQDGPARKFVSGDSMPMYESRWINTGIRITEPVRIEVTGNGLHNQGMPSCGSNGCATPQISGSRVADGANHMAVIGRVGNGNLFMIGTGAVVDPAEFGTGELFVTVNQVTNNDPVWSNMTGGFYIRAATLSAANTAN